MFDKQKLKQLEQRSHNRGMLSKEFYNSEQQDLERKRKQMRAELDRQVEERRRQKEQERMENERRIRKQEDEIKSYYKNIQSRDKRVPNQSATMQNSHMKQAKQPYQTYPQQGDSRLRPVQQTKRGLSKPSLQEADILVMPQQDFYYPLIGQQNNTLTISKQNMQNIGNIPLLDLGEEVANKVKKNKQKGTKRQKTLENILEKERQRQKVAQSRQVGIPVLMNREERKSTYADDQSIVGSIVIQKRQTQAQEIEEQVQEVEQENKSLKQELKKNQEALSLLIGAVRSNGKLDKYRMQAERILYGGMQESMSRQEEEKADEKGLMLPKIYIRHQSIMHDYLISAARRNKKGSH